VTRPTNNRTFVESLTKLDLFPSPVRLTFRGKVSHKTPVGAIATVLCVVFVLAYGVFRAIPLVTEQNTTATKNTLLVSKDSPFFELKKGTSWSQGIKISPNVKFAMGLSGGSLPARYGSFEVKQKDGK
jgi:hypothetical protein